MASEAVTAVPAMAYKWQLRVATEPCWLALSGIPSGDVPLELLNRMGLTRDDPVH